MSFATILYHVRPDIDEDEIKPQAELNDDLGLGSLGIIELNFALEEEFGVDITDDEVAEFETIQDIIDCLDEKLTHPVTVSVASI